MKPQVENRVALSGAACIGFSHVRSLTHDAREEVPAVLINKTLPTMVATLPLAGFGAGAFLSEGVKAGLHLGEVVHAGGVVVCAKPRPRSTGAGNSGSAVVGGYQLASRIQKNYTAQTNPAFPGGVGPHPEREPEPV
jgi:hypothetical protein